MGLRVEIREFGYDIGLYNTGVDASRLALADDAVDGHWTITSGPTPGGPVAATSAGGFPIGPWLADSATSAWITPTGNTNGEPGDYTYRTTFDLTGINLATCNLAGQMAADNSVVDILLNGVSTGESASGFNVWTPFSLDAGSGNGFAAGINTLEFVTNNGAPTGPTGLRVEFTDVTGSFVPEPTSVILVLFGAALLSCRRHRARFLG